eukprot:6190513-Pleurochrysis_carterae.AAC.3
MKQTRKEARWKPQRARAGREGLAEGTNCSSTDSFIRGRAARLIQLTPSRFRHRCSSRVLPHARQVHEMRRPALGDELHAALVERTREHPVGVGGDADRQAVVWRCDGV